MQVRWFYYVEKKLRGDTLRPGREYTELYREETQGYFHNKSLSFTIVE
jgi:hypothetical protein